MVVIPDETFPLSEIALPTPAENIPQLTSVIIDQVWDCCAQSKL
jgi:hypothetical protein